MSRIWQREPDPEPARTPPHETPWGETQESDEIADGIHWIETARHAGYWLSPDRLDAMPDHLKACSFTGDCWFEEDSAWCAVPLAFPEAAFGLRSVELAQQTYDLDYGARAEPEDQAEHALRVAELKAGQEASNPTQDIGQGRQRRR